MIKNWNKILKNNIISFTISLIERKIFKGIACIFLIRLVLNTYNIRRHNKNYFKEYNNLELLLNNKTISDYIIFSKFKNMIPKLTVDFNNTPANINEIFNARQIYISDVRITPEYIRFIRPIDLKKPIKYYKSFSKNDNLNYFDIFKKRPDQYNYNNFCEIALNEQLIDKNKIESHNNPIISIILPSYNKQDILLKSVRTIQNQNLKNIEIIIVNDCSSDNSSKVFDYLLETDERIRIFHHMKNLGLFRSRLDGILYSRGKYIILFDTGDLYEDNYVLLDAYNVIEKYNLDSCKFMFRIITDFKNLTNFTIPFNLEEKLKIEKNPKNIKSFDHKIFKHCGNVWNRLVRSNIFIKALSLLNELMLNAYKNFWDDTWYNNIINKVSNNYAIFNRVGYVYFCDGKGEGTPKYVTKEQNSSMIREYISFLYFDYNFCEHSSCKNDIINKLKYYDKKSSIIKIENFISHFEVLNDLLQALIKDPEVNHKDKMFCKNLLYKSIIREKNVNRLKELKIY